MQIFCVHRKIEQQHNHQRTKKKSELQTLNMLNISNIKVKIAFCIIQTPQTLAKEKTATKHYKLNKPKPHVTSVRVCCMAEEICEKEAERAENNKKRENELKNNSHVQ
jgi:hypothetical protein